MTKSRIANLTRPSSPVSSLPYAEQMSMLRADIALVHRTEGPLRKLHPWARGHFMFRLADAKAKQIAA